MPILKNRLRLNSQVNIAGWHASVIALITLIIIMAGFGLSGLQQGKAPTKAATACPTSSTLLWCGDFETGDLSQFSYHSLCSDAPGATSTNPGGLIVTSPTRSGHYAAKFSVDNDDVHGDPNCPNNGSSSGAAQGILEGGAFKPGDDKYVGFSVYFPTGFTFPNDPAYNSQPYQWLGISEIYALPFNGAPPINIDLTGNHLSFHEHQTATNPTCGQANCYYEPWEAPTPIVLNTWNDIVMHVHATTDNTGFIEIWDNGVQQTFSNGSKRYNLVVLDPNINWNGSQANAVYLYQYRQVGIVPNGAFETLYLDDAKIGTTYAAVAPGGTPTSPPAPTVTLSASPTNINYGAGSTISWTTTNASSCTGSGGSGSWASAKAVNSGSAPFATGALTSSKTYTLSCTGPGGGPIVKSVSITVNGTMPPPPAPVINSFKASPPTINSGDSSTLTWTATNATSCGGSAGPNNWLGSRSSPFVTGVLSSSQTYVLSCTGAGGTITSNVSVTVNSTSPPPPGGGTITPPAPVSIGGNANGPPPTVSGNISFVTSTRGAKKVTYSVDGKTVPSSTLNTENLSDGSHTVVATITEPDGQVVTEKQTIKVNNHQGFIKNAMLKYGKAATIGGTTVISLLVLLVASWYFIFRPRPLLLHEMLEHTALLNHHHDQENLPPSPATDYDIHSGQSIKPPVHTPGTVITPEETKDK